MPIAKAIAYPNIALIKYWGKFDDEENLPATASLSMTLDQCPTTTTAEVIDSNEHQFTLNSQQLTRDDSSRIFSFLDHLCAHTNKSRKLRVMSTNAIPTASGLASSASGFSALTLACEKALQLQLSFNKKAALAQLGSASAARSLLPGFVLQNSGENQQLGEPVVEAIQTSLDVRMIVLQCGREEKKISSREGMLRTQHTSAFYDTWLNGHFKDTQQALYAINDLNVEALGSLMESSTLKMHATTLTSKPAFWYFNAQTLAIITEIQKLREVGHICFFTMDAGPHVKVLCPPHEADFLHNHFKKKFDLVDSFVSSPGPGAKVEESHDP